jgi:Putative amidoligase enzyme
MPTIREWMYRYNELVRNAHSRGIRRGPDGSLLHELTNLRVSNNAAAARVGALQTYLDATSLLPGGHSIIPIPAASPPIPVTTEPTFGVEIECLFPITLNQSRIAAALNTTGVPTEVEIYNHSRRGHWKIITDGSLSSNPGTNAYELVSPVLTGQSGLEQIVKVCNALVGLGAIVNRSCGFHVHVGVSSTIDNADFFKRLVRIYKQYGSQIEAVLAPSRRQSGNSYCRDFRVHSDTALEQCQSVVDVIRLVNGPEPRDDRYYKLNLNAYFRHRTVEFRQHQGTLDAQKATMWTRFCLKIVATAAKTATLRAVNNLAELLDQIEANADERTYFLARQAHFYQLETTGDV